MEVTAWSNGAYHTSGAGYGLKVDTLDRDRYFSCSWPTIILELPWQTDPVEVNIAKASLWSNTCRELISRDIGKWLIDHKYAPWGRGRPPKYQLRKVVERHFKLSTT